MATAVHSIGATAPSNVINHPRRAERIGDDLVIEALAVPSRPTEDAALCLRLARAICRGRTDGCRSVLDGIGTEDVGSWLECFSKLRAAFAEAYAAVGIASDRLKAAVS